MDVEISERVSSYIYVNFILQPRFAKFMPLDPLTAYYSDSSNFVA